MFTLPATIKASTINPLVLSAQHEGQTYEVRITGGVMWLMHVTPGCRRGQPILNRSTLRRVRAGWQATAADWTAIVKATVKRWEGDIISGAFTNAPPADADTTTTTTVA